MSDIGNKQIFAQNLTNYMNKKNIDRYDLCEALDLKYSTLSEWISAKKYPRIDKIEKLANYFNIPKSALIEKQLDVDIIPDVSNISEVIPNSKIYQIPVYESVSAGFGAYASDCVIDIIPIVIDNPHDVADTIAIRVSGDSMYPKIEDGDIIVVRKQDSVDSGDVAVMLLDGYEGLVKKVIYDETWIELHSFNPMYPVRRFDDEEVLRLRVVGKVLKIVKTL